MLHLFDEENSSVFKFSNLTAAEVKYNYKIIKVEYNYFFN